MKSPEFFTKEPSLKYILLGSLAALGVGAWAIKDLIIETGEV